MTRMAVLSSALKAPPVTGWTGRVGPVIGRVALPGAIPVGLGTTAVGATVGVTLLVAFRETEGVREETGEGVLLLNEVVGMTTEGDVVGALLLVTFWPRAEATKAPATKT